MDYKELIDAMRGDSIGIIVARSHDAADAIETLLAERDAAMKYIPKACSTCKHWDAGGCNAPIAGGECAFDLRQAWQWRGPQKEGTDDGQA